MKPVVPLAAVLGALSLASGLAGAFQSGEGLIAFSTKGAIIVAAVYVARERR